MIHQLFDGVYGAFMNTDGFTVGAAAETDAAFNIVRAFFHPPNIFMNTSQMPRIPPVTVGDSLFEESTTLCMVQLGLFSTACGTSPRTHRMTNEIERSWGRITTSYTLVTITTPRVDSPISSGRNQTLSMTRTAQCGPCLRTNHIWKCEHKCDPARINPLITQC